MQTEEKITDSIDYYSYNAVASEFVSTWYFLSKSLNVFCRHSTHHVFDRVTVLTFQSTSRFVIKSHILEIRTGISVDFVAVHVQQMVQDEYFFINIRALNSSGVAFKSFNYC